MFWVTKAEDLEDLILGLALMTEKVGMAVAVADFSLEDREVLKGQISRIMDQVNILTNF